MAGERIAFILFSQKTIQNTPLTGDCLAPWNRALGTRSRRPHLLCPFTRWETWSPVKRNHRQKYSWRGRCIASSFFLPALHRCKRRQFSLTPGSSWIMDVLFWKLIAQAGTWLPLSSSYVNLRRCVVGRNSRFSEPPMRVGVGVIYDSRTFHDENLQMSLLKRREKTYLWIIELSIIICEWAVCVLINSSQVGSFSGWE